MEIVLKMRILQVVEDFPPCVAGDGIHVYLISKELVKRGHDVTVFTLNTGRNTDRASDDCYEQKIVNGVKVKYFRPLLRLSYYSVSLELCREVLKEDFDLMHIHRYFSLQSPLVTLVSRFKKKPIIFTPHSTTIREKKDTFTTLLNKIFDKTFGYYLLRWPNIVIALTQENIKDFLKQGVKLDRIRLIPNGIDLEKFDNLPDSSKFKERYGISGKVVLFIGRLVKYKGVHYLLQIAPDILKVHPETKFVIVGPDYGYKSKLYEIVKKLKLQKSVIFTGGISSSELIEAYAAADVFAFPSIHEGFGLVLLEAMACKKPVVAWKTSAMQYVIEDKISGILVDPFNLDKFANSICLLLSDDELAKKMGEEGEKILKKKFNLKIVIDSLEKVYKEAIANRI